METKTATIRIKNNITFIVNYSTLENLAEQISETLFKLQIGLPDGDDAVTVEYEPDKIVVWHFGAAQMCFSNGQITVSKFVELSFLRDTKTDKFLNKVGHKINYRNKVSRKSKEECIVIEYKNFSKNVFIHQLGELHDCMYHHLMSDNPSECTTKMHKVEIKDIFKHIHIESEKYILTCVLRKK